MKIKRLEISGFKSFADQVMLDFQQPVTGIVGPNGCGKSNIVDAIRWCMGEQSAKHLRGKAMEDVIFAGSETRKPLGIAEVTLTFSTEDGRAPTKYLDYAEIQLTRRLYREGESDYLLNKTTCRLLDITELFMDTGVGTRAYSIIEQGKIGQILHSRPEERRFLIEEAAGVTKYKARKQLALKKIESTRLNLTRLADVLGEIRRQLSSLQRQAKKAVKFRELRDEMREIDILFVAQDYLQLIEQANNAKFESDKVEADLHLIEQKLAKAETDAETAHISTIETEKTLQCVQEELYRIKSEFGNVENRLQFRRKECLTQNERLERLKNEALSLETRLQEYSEKRQNLELQKECSGTDTTTLESDLTVLENQLKQLQVEEEQRLRLMENRRKELFNKLSTSAQLKTNLENRGKRLAQLSEHILRTKRENTLLSERMAECMAKKSKLELSIGEKQEEEGVARGKILKLKEQESALNIRTTEIEKVWQSTRDNLNRTSSRLHSLKELQSQFAGFGQGVKNLMKSKKTRNMFNGILADAIEAPPELEVAVEAVLADKLQALLCRDKNDVNIALNYLRNSKGGRATFATPVNFTPQKISLQGCKMLSELIHFNGEVADLLKATLSNVVFVDTLEQGFENAMVRPELIFVTAQGDLITAGGLISGGSEEQLQSGMVHKKREIRELEGRVTALEEEFLSVSSERDALKRQSQEIANNLKLLATTIHQIELSLTVILKDQQQTKDEIKRILDRQGLQELEAANQKEEEEWLKLEISRISDSMADTTVVSKELEGLVNATKNEIESEKVRLAAVREQVTNIRVQVARGREQHEAYKRAIIDLERQTIEIRERLAANKIELEKNTAEIEELNISITTDQSSLERLLVKQQECDKNLQVVKEGYEISVSNQNMIDMEIKGYREGRDALRRKHSELSVRLSTLSMQRELSEQNLMERHRISIQEAVSRLDNVTFDPINQDLRRIEIQRKIDEIGEVNLMAIEEFAQMEERFNFLSTQKDDLEESLKSLQQAIQRINRTTRQRFQETFELVNNKFKEVFPRLFCGGTAELRLTNEEDLLESGIDIIVQPPGKKLQNVMLLSGGEKALTAVALIFSIFLIKPTPFCLLDEVDAPLDDANIGRFNDMVREMSAISQFIIITHNKATMQVADTLYGITMEEPGASKVVSVRLH